MKVLSSKPIHEGNGKDIYQVGDPSDKLIAIRFTNGYKLFDLFKTKFTIRSKGESNCACAVKTFEIAKSVGIPNIFIEQIDETTILVKQVQGKYKPPYKLENTKYMVPAEAIHRDRIFGSIYRDFKRSKYDPLQKMPTDFGFPSDKMPEAGTKFPRPVNMYTTKFEDRDYDITIGKMLELCGLSEDDEKDIRHLINKMFDTMAYEFYNIGFILADGKFDCIIGEKREKMLGICGTLDTIRICLAKDFAKGVHTFYSKEFLSESHVELGAIDQVKFAKDFGYPATIHALSQETLDEASKRFRHAAENYAGVIIHP